jgi:ATP-dependent Zn protease
MVELQEFVDPTQDEDIKDIIMMYLAGPAAEYEFNFTKKMRFISFDDCYQDLFKNHEWGSDIRNARKGAMILAQNYCEKNYKVFDQKMVKQEADRILKECYRQTLIQVHAQRSDIQAVALVLLEKKTISGKTFYAIMRERKAL